MNKNIAVMLLLGITSIANAQKPEVITKRGYTLTFSSNDPKFDVAVKTRMINTFFQVYPILAKEFNPKTPKTVVFEIDTAYKEVAATSGEKIVYNPDWFKKFPGDIDVVTHEVMHIVQNYGNGGGPGWLTEGIADYVRYKFGVDNAGAKWTLTPLKPSHSYKNSYRITARFLNWLETNGNNGIVMKLDKAMRNHTYNSELWKKITSKTLDELWADYSANPGA